MRDATCSSGVCDWKRCWWCSSTTRVFLASEWRFVAQNLFGKEGKWTDGSLLNHKVGIGMLSARRCSGRRQLHHALTASCTTQLTSTLCWRPSFRKRSWTTRSTAWWWLRAQLTRLLLVVRLWICLLSMSWSTLTSCSAGLPLHNSRIRSQWFLLHGSFF